VVLQCSSKMYWSTAWLPSSFGGSVLPLSAALLVVSGAQLCGGGSGGRGRSGVSHRWLAAAPPGTSQSRPNRDPLT
jgi:hypothetical protein